METNKENQAGTSFRSHQRTDPKAKSRRTRHTTAKRFSSTTDEISQLHNNTPIWSIRQQMPERKLLHQVSDVARLSHLSLRTEEACHSWIRTLHCLSP